MAIFDFIRNAFGNTLYYPGCLTKFAAPDIKENYIKILNKIGLDFILIPEFFCCGTPAANAGYKRIAEQLKEKNVALFRKYGITRIVTNCPSCYHEFKPYKQFKVEHITEVLAKKLHKLPQHQTGEITYQEPCHLGRKSGIYEQPREILRHLGFEIRELDNNREKALCCGAGGGLKTNYPELSNKIAKKYFKTAKSKRVVTACPLCYLHLKDNAPDNVKVYELSQVILKRLENE